MVLLILKEQFSYVSYTANCNNDLIIIYYLGIGDLNEVLEQLEENDFPYHRWNDLGLKLGINQIDLDAIKSQDVKDCLRGCLTLWLQWNYDIEKYDKPTMESLTGALRRIGLKAAASGILGEQDRASSVVTLNTNTSSRERRKCLIV